MSGTEPIEAPERADHAAQTIQRLAALGRLWGAVKYFHPYLAYREIDWDAALVDTIPLVRQASDREAFRAAVDHLLSVLDDRWTTTLPWPGEQPREPPAAGPAEPPAGPTVVRTDGDIAVVVANDYRLLGGEDGAQRLREAFEEARRSRAIVVDIRRLVDTSAARWPATRTLEQSLEALLDRPIRTAGSRRRMYTGHPPQRGTSTGGYSTGFVYEQGASIGAGGPAGSHRPLAFVVNPESAALWKALAGLQCLAGAVVVTEGDVDPDLGGPPAVLDLGEGVRVRARGSELVYPDGSVGFRPDAVVAASQERAWDKSPGVAAALECLRGARRPGGTASAAAPSPSPVPAAPPDRLYADMTAPSREYRLLALFRLWTAIDVFFPYKDLMDRDWGATLAEFVPEFDRDGDANDYVLTVARLAARIQDTHASVTARGFTEHVGVWAPAVRLRHVAGAFAIEHVLEATADGPRVGDVVVAVDGVPSGARAAALEPLYAASTPQAMRRRLAETLLAGPKDTVAGLTLRGADGAEREVALTRSTVWWQRVERASPVFWVLPAGFGYVDLARLTVAQVDEAFEAVKETRGLIFDMRGYPKGTAWAVAPRLTATEVVTARFEAPQLLGFDWWFGMRGARTFDQRTAPSAKWRYGGKVVVLVDESAISQAEHTCLFLEASADVTFVGAPTNGANGDVTNVVLPGDVLVGFSGHAVRHADGRQLQRVGIQPHVHAAPTLRGLRAGRDEVLEAGVRVLAEWVAARNEQP